MLLAVSYAYFTASVVGNEDAESITVEAAKMSLKLTGPTEVTLPNALPGTEVKSEFTVTNTGTVQTTYNLDMIDVTNTFVDKGDLVYSITSTNEGGHAENVIAPQTSQTLIRNILIQPGEDNAQVYTLTVRFRETGVDQNSNQGKKFSGRIQINKLEDKSLVAAILRANPIQDSKGLDLEKGSPACGDTSYDGDGGYYCTSFVDNGDGLFTAPDDDGTSYYFRGDKNKLNNNVTFANMNWRILRINGDGSIRLVLNDENGPSDSAYNEKQLNGYDRNESKYVGYTYDNEHNCTHANPCISVYDEDTANFKYNYKDDGTGDSTIKGALEEWYKIKLSSYDSQIALTAYCNDTSYAGGYEFQEFYGSKQRIETKQPILTCPTNNGDFGGVYKLKIGLITFDELYMGGLNPEYKYMTDYDSPNNYLYFYHQNYAYTMSPYATYVMFQGTISAYGGDPLPYYTAPRFTSPQLHTISSVVPVINLKPDVTFTGTGTEDDPYTITK